ncbi:MAG: protein-disulfide reductase DsbD N-terminal domain-containing protein [Blastocatellia bacterium]|nr:protein-disulfide reductase DsbD N-terminal domain-containing protein [Blastocatellia bacterium]
MKLRKLSLFVLIGCLSAQALAQSSDKVVKVKPEESVYKVKKGASVPIKVVIDIDKGYHINSNRPREEFLIATALTIERLPGLTTTRVVYPKAKLQKFEFSETPMSVYEGKAVLSFTARAGAKLAAGRHTLKAKLRVQACNDKVCLRPQNVNVEIPIEVM